MRDKASWYVVLHDAQTRVTGIGECGPLPGLNPEFSPDFESTLNEHLQFWRELEWPETAEAGLQVIGINVPAHMPSLRFALETAWLDFIHGGTRRIFESPFLQGEPIKINGLIWMGTLDFMMDQIQLKVNEGFTCLKLKVGGLDFERECDVLRYIRKRYYKEDLEIRLDANGAFKPDDVLYKLEELARFTIHSIEQPLKPKAAELAELCRKSPIPVALDEELIGVTSEQQQLDLLKTNPAYLILKPTLHGGLSGCKRWIELAEEHHINWWLTSALESSIGLNAIAQFASTYPLTIPQGLGTGSIYTNNIESPLVVKKGELWHTDKPWNVAEIIPD